MKKIALFALVCFILTSGVVYVTAQTKPKDITITGHVIDFATYAMKGAYGEDELEAMKYRAEGGFPVGIYNAEEDKMYIAVYRNPAPAAVMETANKVLTPLMGMEVVIRGRLFEVKGVNLVEIRVISEM